MGNIYSNTNGDIKEYWSLKITLNAGEQPLPNIKDFGRATIGLNYCLYNESEHKKKLPVKPKLSRIETLEKILLSLKVSVLSNGKLVLNLLCHLNSRLLNLNTMRPIHW